MPQIFSYVSDGDWNRTRKFLEEISKRQWLENILNQYIEEGCSLLKDATPKDTGETANSWYGEINTTSSSISLEWHNDKMGNDGKTPVVFLIINGHGTRTGGYVPPNDFVTSIMDPLFEKIESEMEEVVKSL